LILQRKKRPFECEEQALDSGYCKFHDPDYLEPNTENEIRDLIQKKIESAIESNSDALDCVGYILPTLNLENKKFTISVFFTYAKFKGDVIIDHSEFLQFVDFSNCKFEKEASFSNVIFKDNVNFNSSDFLGKSNFDSVKFVKRVDFVFGEFGNISFLSAEFNESDFSGRTFNHYATFSFSEFNAKTDFSNADFKEDVNFFASKFLTETNFSYSNFSNFANFRRIVFLNSEQVFFDGDLSRVSFLETDISRVRFGNQVKWKIEEKKGSNRFTQFFL